MKAAHLYVHVPFCARRCVYCDFSIAVRSRVPVQEFVDAVAREWDLRHSDSALRLSTVYLGGGTPSRLGGEGISRLMDLVRGRAELQPDAEVTLEANPEDVNTEAARAWLAAGINRVSLGVQSFDDAVLTWMHRTHDAQAAMRGVDVLREVGISNLSIDLIFATPPQVQRSWERDLTTALGLEVPHVSVYGLTVEPHTPLGRWVARSTIEEATEERFEREYLLTHDALVGAGLDHYEVSNYGRPGWHSRHNWAYWNRKAYAGLGPSAHEFDGRVRRWNTAAYAEWLARLRRDESPVDGSEELRTDQTSAEQIYLYLRTNQGIQLRSDDEARHVEPWIKAGWAVIGSDRVLCLTATGWLRLDALASDLTLFRSR